jgi:hypothetical protein
MRGPPVGDLVPGLRDHLRRIGTARDKLARRAAFDALAAAAENAGTAHALVHRFLSEDANGQRFALEIAVRLGPPLPDDLIRRLVPLLQHGRFPTRLRIGVSAIIIRSIPTDSPLVDRLIEALLDEVSPPRAANRLRRLAALVPALDSVNRALAELDGRPAAPCPRCGARLGPDDLVKHLWERHRLLLENGRVREPWDVVREWVAEYDRTNRAEHLDRACDLAQALDPTEGLTRVHRLLLAGGSDDEVAHALLRAEAVARHASLCPHCYALVPQPLRAVPTPVLVTAGRVEGGGYKVELADRCFVNQMVVATPEAVMAAGTEPGNALTRRGAVLTFLVPLVALAGLFALLPALFGVAPVVPVAGLLFAGLVAYVAIRVVWRERGGASDRAVDHAWGRLVPRLLQHGARKADAAFVAGLAEASRGRGDARARVEEIDRVYGVLREDRGGMSYVTPISTLRIADASGGGADDVPLIADEASPSFEVALPLDHGERLVRELRGDSIDHSRRARLRVLLLARAFAAGLEPQDLRVIGRVSPALGAAYASEDRGGLSRLRLLWLYRPHRLWQRVGSATTVFDLARYPKLAENYLKQRPDLLLFQATAGSEDPAPILVCEEGVVYRDTVITDADTPIHVRAKTSLRGGGFELTVGDRVFKFNENPTLLARRLKEWTQFLFKEFLPRARLLSRRRSDHGDWLLRQKASTCPECGKTFLGVMGEIGLVHDQSRARSEALGAE